MIDWSQNGALGEAVPGPRGFVHEVPCPKLVAAKLTKRHMMKGRKLDSIMRVSKGRLKLVRNGKVLKHLEVVKTTIENTTGLEQNRRANTRPKMSARQEPPYPDSLGKV